MPISDTELSGPFRTTVHALSDMRARDLLFLSAHLVKRASGMVIANYSSMTEFMDLAIDESEWFYLVLEK